MVFTRPWGSESEVEDNTMMHIVRMIKRRHPQHAHQIIALLLITSALTLLAGITLLLN